MIAVIEWLIHMMIKLLPGDCTAQKNLNFSSSMPTKYIPYQINILPIFPKINNRIWGQMRGQKDH